jgi:hypothetical protein
MIINKGKRAQNLTKTRQNIFPSINWENPGQQDAGQTLSLSNPCWLSAPVNVLDKKTKTPISIPK